MISKRPGDGTGGISTLLSEARMPLRENTTCQPRVTTACQEWSSFVNYTRLRILCWIDGSRYHPAVSTSSRLASNPLLQFPDAQCCQYQIPRSCQRSDPRTPWIRSRRQRDFHTPPALRPVARQPTGPRCTHRKFTEIRIIRTHNDVVE